MIIDKMLMKIKIFKIFKKNSNINNNNNDNLNSNENKFNKN